MLPTPAPATEATVLTPETTSTLNNTYGMLLGGVIGDALGTPLLTLSTKVHITDFSDFTELKILPGIWSQNTSSLLCAIKANIDSKFDAVVFKSCVDKWRKNGEFTPLGKCINIYRNLIVADPLSTDNTVLPRIAACTSLDNALSCCRVTHNSVTALDASAYLFTVLSAAVTGTSKKDLFSSKLYNSLNLNHTSVLEIRKFRKVNSSDALATLINALVCFKNSDSFEEGLLLAVNTTYDAPVVATIYGQIAGAYYGLLSIDRKYLTPLINTPLLMSVFDAGCQYVKKYYNNN